MSPPPRGTLPALAVLALLAGGVVGAFALLGSGPQWPTYLVYVGAPREVPESEYVHFEQVDSIDEVRGRFEDEHVVGALFDRSTLPDLAAAVAAGWEWDASDGEDWPGPRMIGGFEVSAWQLLRAARHGVWPPGPYTGRLPTGEDADPPSADPTAVRALRIGANEVLGHVLMHPDPPEWHYVTSLRMLAERASLGCTTGGPRRSCDAPDGRSMGTLMADLDAAGLLEVEEPARE